jgi:prepilin-type N-terminal cleavage/methylation domain-containing protein
MRKIFFKKEKKDYQRGFTLVELLITIVIFVMLTGVVLFNQNKFDSTVLLKNLAYDIALTIRQAQTYGVNVKESQQSGNFSSYGVYIKSDETQKIIFFSDIDGDKSFSDEDMSCPANDVDSECMQKYTLKRGNYISKICVMNTGESSCLEISELTIYFKRPNPDAYIYADGSTVTSEYSEIEISSVDNSSKVSVVITSVGQIYVKKQ